MTSLNSISMSQLAKDSTGLGLVKSGNGKDKGERTPFVDPFTLGKQFPIEITGEEITTRPSGTPQVAISVSIMMADGSLQKAGKLWVDLPQEGVTTAGMTAEEEAAATSNNVKTGAKFLRFLRAVRPDDFNVFAEIDKSNPKKWIYLDAAGEPMSPKARDERAAEIDAAVMGVAAGLVDGTVSLTGSRCYVTKKASNNPKYPWVNFDAI